MLVSLVQVSHPGCSDDLHPETINNPVKNGQAASADSADSFMASAAKKVAAVKDV